jgi:hypothetical protein
LRILSGCYTFSYTLCVLYFACVFVPFALRLVVPELGFLLLPLCFFLGQLLHSFLYPVLNGFLPPLHDYLPLPIGFLAALAGFTQPWLGCLSVSLGSTSAARSPTTGVARFTMSFSGLLHVASLTAGAPSLSEPSPADPSARYPLSGVLVK